MTNRKAAITSSLSLFLPLSLTLLLSSPMLSPASAFAATTASQANQPSTNSNETIKFTPRFPEATTTGESVRAAISEIDQLAQKQVNENVVPGMAIAIVYKDAVVFVKGYGVRSTATTDKIDPDTVFQLASVSKSLAATAVASLVGEGKISWDSKICDLDPAFAMYDPWVTSQLTVRDLFAHRSGLPDHAGDPLEDLGFDRAQVLHRLRFQKPDSSLRAHYAYTNFGLTEGAVAAARAYDTSWEDVCQSRLYAPLGMNSTSSRHSDFVARTNKAQLHVLVDGKWVAKNHRDPDAQSPAGGASASVNDLAKWMRMHLAGGKFEGKQIIAAAPLAEAYRPHMFTHYSPITGLPEFYGLGFNVGYDREGRLHLSHSGGFAMGAATNFQMIPSENLGICVLTNACPIGVAEGIASTFSDLALYGKTTQNWIALYRQVFSDPSTLAMSKAHDYKLAPPTETAALKNAAYLGVYHNDLAGDLEISERDGGLAMAVGPKKTVFALKHYDHDTFTYVVNSENTIGVTGLTFSIQAGGKASSVVLENLNEFGQGEFMRVERSPGK
ncbi:MAG TPA: serine hydrolase [Oculatellaceae cyanobacterium]